MTNHPFMFKPGVDLRDLRVEILFGAVSAASVFNVQHVPFVITSGRDGRHKAGSLHYQGLAIDIRLASRFYAYPPDIDRDLLSKCQAALGDNFDMILEDDHFHLEFDPPALPSVIPA